MTTTRTHCPACGAKLPERSREMSNCLYCGLPFEFSEAAPGSETTESPFRARLQRVIEHPDCAVALAWNPPHDLAYHQARAMRSRGFLVAGIGLACLAGALFGGSAGTPWFARPLFLFGLFGLGVGLHWIAKGLRAMKVDERWPLLRRAAAIVDRRSVVTPRGLGGQTDYHFLTEFEDGNRAEFIWLGRGTSQEPLSTGITGVAYTRGTKLVSFRQIRT